MAMSASAEARQNSVDGVLLGVAQVPDRVADDLFAVVDALDGSPPLRRTLVDPALSVAQRRQTATVLLQGKIDPVALQVVTHAVGLTWRSGRGLADAIERQAVRATLLTAQKAGRLDEVEESLFRFGRVVDADRELRAALGNPQAPLALRQHVVAQLLGAKAPAETLTLAQRAVKARRRTFDLTIENYLLVSAQLRRRIVATVRVATELTAEQQARLRAALTAQAQRPVEVQVVVDPAVVGGVRVEMGDEVIDGSVAGRLEAARRQMT